MQIFLFLTIAALGFLNPSSCLADELTCTDSVGGNWNFGTAPRACNISPLLNTPQITLQYATVFFDDGAAVSKAREDYLSSMYSVIREVGHYYIQKRNPKVSSTEVEFFIQGLYTLAHQESFWSHYREGTDGIVRYMRGDNLHGHGMMQVDDRSHVAALKNGRGADLVYNMIYGLDIFYAAWVKSTSSSCISSVTDYKNRTRAAWSAYNGGPGAICRWKTKNTAGDQQFLAKYNAKAWAGYVKDPSANSKLDIQCLAEGQRPCQALGETAPPATPPAAPPIESLPGYRVGDQVRIVSGGGINLRNAIKGKILLRIPKSTPVYVDQVVIQNSTSEAYVKVTYQGVAGFLYGGQLKPQKTYSQWIVPVATVPTLASLTLNSSLSYGYLRQCPSLKCTKTTALVREDQIAPALQIIKTEGDWAFVHSPELKADGWIALRDVQELAP